MLKYDFELSRSDLLAMDRLGSMVWIFDADRHQIQWANRPAIKFWDALSLEELRRRDFTSDSQWVKDRMRGIASARSTREAIQEIWTLYPKGNPITVSLRFSPCSTEPSKNAVFVECMPIAQHALDDVTKRMIEAVRTLKIRLSTFTLCGQLLSQNYSAQNFWARANRQGGRPDTIESRFGEISKDMLLEVAKGSEFETELNLAVNGKSFVTALWAARGRDPISGSPVLVMREEDVSEQARLREKLQMSKSHLEQTVAKRTKSLMESQERYHMALQAVDVWDWNVPKDDLFLTDGLRTKLGYSEESWKSLVSEHGMASMVHPDDRTRYEKELARHISDATANFTNEHRFLCSDGSYKWFKAKGTCYFSGSEPSRSVGILVESTEQKLLEQQLFEAKGREATVNLTGGIAHEFNNILAVVMGNAELLDQYGVGHSDLIDEIIGAVKRAADLTRRMLAFAGKQLLKPQQFNLSAFVEKVATTSLQATIGPTIEINCVETRLDVIADPVQLEIALLQLVVNASQSDPDGNPIRITVSHFELSNVHPNLKPGQYARIDVRDFGEGMARESVEQAFIPFFSTRRVGEGSGLGLPMVLGFCRQTGGDAEIVSEQNYGTTVSIYLPLAFGKFPGKQSSIACAQI